MTEAWAEERGRRRRRARDRARETRAYHRALRPWYLQAKGVLVLLVAAAALVLYALPR